MKKRREEKIAHSFNEIRSHLGVPSVTAILKRAASAQTAAASAGTRGMAESVPDDARAALDERLHRPELAVGVHEALVEALIHHAAGERHAGLDAHAAGGVPPGKAVGASHWGPLACGCAKNGSQYSVG